MGSTGLSNALTDFGPDQMDIVRFTKLWQDFDPVAGRLDYIMLETWHAYREEYPGRSLVAIDALNSKKYPPDPIRVSNVGSLDDLGNGTLSDASVAEAFVFDHIIDVHGPDTSDSQDADLVCAPPDTTDPDRATWCDPGCILSPMGRHCISQSGSEIYNAPVDIILWDFQGVSSMPGPSTFPSDCLMSR